MPTPAPPRNIVWIASYPKSGNTWVRFLACNLLFGRQESAASLNLLAPDVHELAGEIAKVSQPLLVKSHFMFSPAMPLAERTAAAIYVVRDPADVLVSNFHYAQRSGAAGDVAQASLDAYVQSFIANRGDPRWIDRGMGGWEDNVRSWLTPRHSFPVVRLRYEDLALDPIAACRQVAQLLRPASAEEELRTAVENSSFQRMREVEEADIRARRVGIFYKPYLQPSIDSGVRFMRRGTVGEGGARLTPAQRARLRATFASLLPQLGYPLGSGHPEV